jgi:hypothetical protein
MTIKRNGEKVILKGGKVSCSCCEDLRRRCIDMLLRLTGLSEADISNSAEI